MPFSRIRELTGLAVSIDTAVARNDDIGMDMLRDMLPEVREMIDDVNGALREVDALLFEGLRDEALSLNEPEFSSLAARLHLEDRAGWPAVQSFFTAEGINLPPKLDFDTLTSMESAYAELEHLRRHLDKLRRLNLERAPLEHRLALLRKLRDIDPTKPVWPQAIAAHEEARVGELHEAVRRAVEARDPERIATLHAELVDPEWGIPVPRDLIRNTRGADLWSRMRTVASQAEEAAAALELAHAHAANQGATPDLVARLQHARQRWQEAEAEFHSCRVMLNDCPQASAFVREEGLESRVASLAPRVQQPLQWLAMDDAREGLVLQHQQVCGQLDSLVDHPPVKLSDESTWLASVARLETDLAHCCQLDPSLGYPDLLREKVRRATESVKGREGRRRRFFASMVAVGVLALAGIVWSVSSWRAASIRANEVRAEMTSFLEQARSGAYAEMPDVVLRDLTEYGDDKRIERLGAGIKEEVERESNRREVVAKALEDFHTAVERARAALEARAKDQRSRLDPWDTAVTDAAQAWRDARRRGGNPAKREPVDTTAEPLESRPGLAQDALKTEEASIESSRQEQERLEGDYAKAAKEEFRRQRKIIEDGIDAIPKDDEAGARMLLDDLQKLIEQGNGLRAERGTQLLGHSPGNTLRVPRLEIEQAETLRLVIEKRLAP